MQLLQNGCLQDEKSNGKKLTFFTDSKGYKNPGNGCAFWIER